MMHHFQDIPKTYIYCFADEQTCPKANTCLRALAGRLLVENPDVRHVDTLSPYYIKNLPSPGDCEFYRSGHVVRFASGMTHLFDEVPHRVFGAVRSAVMNCFSCESYFYQCRKGERLITPNEQKRILDIFRRKVPGITPSFDRYEDKLDW